MDFFRDGRHGGTGHGVSTSGRSGRRLGRDPFRPGKRLRFLKRLRDREYGRGPQTTDVDPETAG